MRNEAITVDKKRNSLQVLQFYNFFSSQAFIDRFFLSILSFFFYLFYLYLSSFSLVSCTEFRNKPRISRSDLVARNRESRLDEVINTMPPFYRSVIVAMTK